MLPINCWLISLNDIKQRYTASFVYKNYKNSICTKEILNYSEFLFVDGFHDVIKPADQQSHPLPQQTSNFLISHKTKWLAQQCHPLSVENHCKILKLITVIRCRTGVNRPPMTKDSQTSKQGGHSF